MVLNRVSADGLGPAVLGRGGSKGPLRGPLLSSQGEALELRDVAMPEAGPAQIRLRVKACGLCRTDLHVVDGDLKEPKLPLVPGHQIVGVVDQVGADVRGLAVGDRVGVPWLGGSCGRCRYCQAGDENLCDSARYTGYQIDGGFADYCVADARFCFALSAEQDDVTVAPLLCAGLIGYRALRMTGDATELGFYGFGSAAHLMTQVARHQGRRVYAFTRASDVASRGFALGLGATWAGPSDERPEVELDAAILFAPAGELLPLALKAVRKGGTVVCAGIHMSDIPSFPYALLWGERVVRSVANLTRRDGIDFLAVARTMSIVAQTTVYGLEEANRALGDLRRGDVQGSAVLRVA